MGLKFIKTQLDFPALDIDLGAVRGRRIGRHQEGSDHQEMPIVLAGGDGVFDYVHREWVRVVAPLIEAEIAIVEAKVRLARSRADQLALMAHFRAVAAVDSIARELFRSAHRYTAA